jgi:hypothetical protein
MTDAAAPRMTRRRAALAEAARARAVAAARSFVGTRWHHQGRAPGAGLDCVGVAVLAARAAGLDVEDLEGYSRRPDGRSLMQTVESQADRVEASDIQPGDVLVFRIDVHPQHVGVAVGDGRMVHALAQTRSVVEVEIDQHWRDRLVGVYRPRWHRARHRRWSDVGARLGAGVAGVLAFLLVLLSPSDAEAATLALGLAGAAIGSAFGAGATVLGMSAVAFGSNVGMLVGGLIDQMIFRPPPQTIEGPRLESLRVQDGNYGAPIPRIYGRYEMAGNCIWMSDLIERRTETRVGGRGGGKGGGGRGGGATQVTYSYFVNAAFGLTEGPITRVIKITGNNDKIIYQDGQTVRAAAVDIYTGTEDQMPNALMQAALGAENVPAYRGLAYVVIHELALADFGQRPPNLTFEIEGLTGAADVSLQASAVPGGWTPLDQRPVSGGMNTGWKNESIERVGVSSGQIAVAVIRSDSIFPLVAAVRLTGVSADGVDRVFWSRGGSSGALTGITGALLFRRGAEWRVILGFGPSPDFFFLATPVLDLGEVGALAFGHAGDWSYVATLSPGAAPQIVCLRENLAGTNINLVQTVTMGDFVGWTPFAIVAVGTSPPAARVLLWSAGTIAVATLSGASIVGPVEYIGGFSGLPPSDLRAAPRGGQYSGRWLFEDGASLYSIDLTPGATRMDRAPISLDGFGFRLAAVAPDESAALLYGPGGWGKIVPLRAGDMGPVSSAAPLTGVGVGDVDGWAFGHAGNEWTVFDADQPLAQRFRFTSPPGITVEAIVRDLCLRSGLTTADLNLTAFAEPIVGYLVDRPMPTRNAIDPLLAYVGGDIVESDGRLKAIVRTATPTMTISGADLGSRGAEEDWVPPIERERRSDKDLNREITIEFADPSRSFQPNTAAAARMATTATATSKLTIPAAMDFARAKRIAFERLYEGWAAREVVSVRVPLRYAAVDVGDVVAVGDTTFRVERARVSRGAIELTGTPVAPRRDWDTGAFGGLAGKPPTYRGIVPSDVALLDLPALTDDVDAPIAYITSRVPDVLGAWEGGSLFRFRDDIGDYVSAAPLPPRGTYGILTSTLAAPTDAGGLNGIARGMSVNVLVSSGEISTIGFEALINGGNAAALVAPPAGRAWSTADAEIVQFQAAALIGPNRYRLSGFLRGRRGTEWAAKAWPAGTIITMLDRGTTGALVMDLGDVGGAPGVFRPVSIYETIDGAAARETSLLYTGSILRPYAPARLRLVAIDAGTGDRTFSWFRRARLRAGWRSNGDVPLDETREAYLVEVIVSQTGAVLRAAEVETPTWTYAAAARAADLAALAPGQSLVLRVRQISDRVGPGIPALLAAP